MDAKPVYARSKIGPLVDLRFATPPAVTAFPVLDERLGGRQQRTLSPIAHKLLVRPPCLREPSVQIVQCGLWNINFSAGQQLRQNLGTMEAKPGHEIPPFSNISSNADTRIRP